MKELLELLEKIEHYRCMPNEALDSLELFRLCYQDKKLLADLCVKVMKAKDDIEHIKNFFKE